MTGNSARSANTRHLLGIGMNSKGLPMSLFTVNSWVTGDLMLSAANTELLLERMELDSGHPIIDAVLESAISLCRKEIRTLLASRDVALRNFSGKNVLANQSLEVLSEVSIDLDKRLTELEAAIATPYRASR